jgi:hypothetical protein
MILLSPSKKKARAIREGFDASPMALAWFHRCGEPLIYME